MKTINTPTKRHPILGFYALAFAITWGVLFVAVAEREVRNISESP